MANKLFDELLVWGADIDGALDRFMNNEELYIRFINKFPESSPIAKLEECMDKKDYENAVMEAHTLKGVTGNLGFNPLFEDFTKIVNDMRASDYSSIDELFDRIKINYNEVCRIISENR